MIKAIRISFIALVCLLPQYCFAADTTSHSSSINNAPLDAKSNFITVNALPFVKTRLGYEHIFFEHFGIGVDWSYFLPTAGNYYNYYGIDNGDAQGTYTDIDKSYFKIGMTNKFDGFLKLEDDDYDERLHGFIKLFYSYISAQNLSQIYFNSSTFNHRQGEYTDSSVTTFLADNSSNKVYYRQVSFTGWGLGFGFGVSYFIDKACHFLVGIEAGCQNMRMANSAKQPVIVNGEEYYYEYTPAWEGRINADVLYGYVTLSYAF